ncbi:MAG TPA: nucleotidyltransferase domain-containing protein [Polyangiales bacterium]
MSEQQELSAAIARALTPLPEVRAALLFGSRARGRARANSDIDVAVLLDPALAPSDARARLVRLLDALNSELAADLVDLVILNDAPPALAFQVLKYGLVAFERDRVDLHRFRVRTYSLHADYEPVERFFREVTQKRVLGGGRG